MEFASVRELTDAVKGFGTVLTDRVSVSAPPPDVLIDPVRTTEMLRRRE